MEYTQDQLDKYLLHINYPRSQHPQDALERLTQLTIRQLSRVPFESLSLHYSQHKQLSLDPEMLFEKVVVQGKGGYCMELNALFGGMLRAMGYQVLSVGGRVKEPRGWTAWAHMSNLITINQTRYNVDVGFGSHGPMRPVPLEHDFTFTQIAPRQGKLEYRALSQHSDPSQRAWVYSTKENDSSPWEEKNMFVEIEFFQADYEAINLSPMAARTSFFVQNVLAMRSNLNAEMGEIDGVYTLMGNRLKRQMRDSEPEVVAEMKTEEERVRVIEEYFFVKLSEVERRGIDGLATQLGGSAFLV